MPKKQIYLDHAATTPVRSEVLKAMLPYFTKNFGNASAIHTVGQIANGALNDARRTIAGIIHALPDNIIFTSGGTESNNLAIFGVTKAVLNLTLPSPLWRRGFDASSSFTNEEAGGGLARGHIITTAIEHDSVLRPFGHLAKQGWDVTFVPVDKHGRVNPQDVIRAIRPETVLISVMYANNEIGTIEPIADIGRMILRYRKKHNTQHPYFHTDACQAAGYLDLDVEKLHIDLMTINASKIYGPKGVGLLYVRRGVKLEPLMFGGSQEHALRPGTENVAGIVGLGIALALSQKETYRDKEIRRLRQLSEYFWKELQKKIPGVKFNGPEIGEDRLPNNLNVEFPEIEGETLLLYLNEAGIMCSTSSACGLESSEPSHVLQAIGCNTSSMRSSVRFTLGQGTTKDEINYTVRTIAKLQSLLPKS